MRSSGGPTAQIEHSTARDHGRRGRIHGRGRARTCAVGGHDASVSPGETGRTLAFERTALPLSGTHAPPLGTRLDLGFENSLTTKLLNTFSYFSHWVGHALALVSSNDHETPS